MSIWSRVNQGLEIARVCTTAIEVIGGLIKQRGSLKTLEDALNQLDVVGGIVDRVKDVITGKEDPAKARADFEAMNANIKSTNEDIDARIDEEFDSSDTKG